VSCQFASERSKLEQGREDLREDLKKVIEQERKAAREERRLLKKKEHLDQRGVVDSRLEGGVNRAKLKFTNINTTTSRVSVRNINESEREGTKQIASK
jgi:hypothetical protein